MDALSRLNSIMETLRRQVAESGRRMQVTGHTRPPAGNVASSTPRPGLPELKQRLLERLRNIDPDDPHKPYRSRRLFLESVLTWEFGDRLPLDRRFDDLVDKLLKLIDTDPDLKRQMTELLASLPTNSAA